MRGSGALLVIALVLAGCGGPLSRTDNYPFPDEAPSAHQYTPAAIDQPVQAVVLYMRPHINDTVEFLDALAIGKVTGADIKFYLAPPITQPDGQIAFGEQLQPLIGSTMKRTSSSQGPETQYGIVVEVTPTEAGRIEITDLRFNYRLNGGPAETGNGMTTTFTVCGGETTCTAEAP